MVHPRGECGVVAPMEDVLEVYAEPYDPTRPKVNFAETTKPLMKEPGSRCRLPGRPQRSDYAYERNGTRHLSLRGTADRQAACASDSSERRSPSPTRCSGWWTKATPKPR